MGIIPQVKRWLRRLSSGGGVKQLLAGLRRRSGKQEHLHIRLEFNRKVLYEIYDLAASDVITIGRSGDCVWAIPQDDNVASGHHAVIVTRNRRLCIRDTGSRNGIFYQAKRIQEKNLAPGDQIAIGNCTLFVERVKFTGNTQSELVFLNTDRKGQAVRLDKPRTVIGSDQGCDLVIGEQLVSQRHVELACKADGCWLKDLGSKNGTFVNGTRLSPNTERLLVDDDVISISFVDFKYVDGQIEHSKIRIWSSLAIVAITIFVVLALNWLWTELKSSSDTYLGYARREAAAERFDQALEYVQESRSLRGAESNQIAGNELERSLAVWVNIYNSWQKAKSNLNAGNWVEASHVLGMITDSDPNIWGWNDTTAPEMRKEAFAVKKLLDAYLSAETAMRDDRNPKNLSDLKEAVAVIGSSGKLFGPAPPEYLGKLLSGSEALRQQINENLIYLERLDAILARIESEADNLAVVLSDLDELKQHAQPNVRIRIENCMTPLGMLQRAGKQAKLALISLQQLEFDKLDQIKQDLPTLEQCVVNEHIATLRKEQERQFATIRATAAGVQPLVRNLAGFGMLENSTVPECVSIFQDAAVMDRVFACDAFERRMPSRLRTEPAGEYDRVLGIEGFFEFIYALPAPYDQSIYAEFKFQPEIVRFRNLLSAIKTFRTFVDQPQHPWLLSGEIQLLYDKTGTVLDMRNRLAERYLSENYDSFRQTILARAIAIFLSGGEIPEKTLESFTRDVKNMRLPLIQRSREYNTADDEEKVVIRDYILQMGIPGDPVVRRMWGFKNYPR